MVEWPWILFVGLFGFLLASFPARNSDVWAHLANGRAFFDTGSFHPAWLFNLGAYSAYSVLGGAGLAVLKALAAAVLGLLLLRMSWAGGRWGWAVVATCIALVAMSPFLLLQSSLASFVLLGVVAWLEFPSSDKPALTPVWLLLPLFLVWAQLDGGWVFGLAFLACTWLGRRIDGAGSSPGHTLLAFALLACVCLLNPLYGRGFVALPPGRSPFEGAHLSVHGLRPDTLAYLALLAMGILSFRGNRRDWRWARFLPWLAFAGLSAWNLRLVPYFAIVAGPALALNLQEWFAEGEPRRLWVLVRPLGGLFALGALVAVWPGWLRGMPYEPRRWAIETPPAPRVVAETLAAWHREGKLPPGSRGFHVSLDTTHLFTWLCPEDRALHDPAIAASLRGEKGASTAWADQLRAEGVTHVVLYDADRGRLGALLERFFNDPAAWPLLLVEGDVAVFGWRDPVRAPGGDLFAALEFDYERLAYAPPPDKHAPRDPPGNVGPERPWWEAFWKRAPVRSIDTDAATLYLLSAEAARRAALPRHLLAWEAAGVAGLVGVPPSSVAGGALGVVTRLTLARPRSPDAQASVAALPILDQLGLRLRQGFLAEQDDVPPALLYLGIRAGRRGIAENPGDALTHLVLGECYLHLLHATRERVWAARFPELLELRWAQASASLNQALRLQPDLSLAHRLLADLYQQMNYLDLALAHAREADRLERTATPGIEELATEVEKRTRAWEKESGKARVLDRATMAVGTGLAGKARDILLESDVAAFGARGMALELGLLLKTGRLKEVREWMEPTQLQAIGPTAYHWLGVQSRAAGGDYAGADLELVRLTAAMGPDGGGGRAMNARQLLSVMIGQAILDEQPGAVSLAHILSRARARHEFEVRITPLIRGLRQQANVSVIRGLLALEEGATAEAWSYFQSAKRVWKDGISGEGLDFHGREAALVWSARLK